MAMQTSAKVQIETYLRKWMQTAGLDVRIDISWSPDVERMRIGCKSCHTVEMLPFPTSVNEIDWTVQDYVRRHKPGGPHNIEEKQIDLIAQRKALVQEQAALNVLGAKTELQAVNKAINDLMNSNGQTAWFTPDGQSIPLETRVRMKSVRITQGRRFR